MDNCCVCCVAVIPEGWMVCPICERAAGGVYLKNINSNTASEDNTSYPYACTGAGVERDA